MTATERRQRDAKLVADRARGVIWPEIANRQGLSERQARRVVEAWWSRRPVEDVDPDAIVRETLRACAQDLNDLAVLAVETRNDAVRLGAIKAHADVLRSRIEILRSIGQLPFDWRRWQAANEERRLFERLLTVLEVMTTTLSKTLCPSWSWRLERSCASHAISFDLPEPAEC